MVALHLAEGRARGLESGQPDVGACDVGVSHQVVGGYSLFGVHFEHQLDYSASFAAQQLVVVLVLAPLNLLIQILLAHPSERKSSCEKDE